MSRDKYKNKPLKKRCLPNKKIVVFQTNFKKVCQTRHFVC
nr:MAG TPA: hypothetical protein [Caudoviricetes sp.]